MRFWPCRASKIPWTGTLNSAPSAMIAPMSAHAPSRSTGTMAPSRRPLARTCSAACARRCTSTFPVRASESTKNGRAPVYVIALAVAAKVIADVRTTSPEPTPSAIKPRCSAAVPEVSPTAYWTPTRPATSASKAARSGPAGAAQPERMAASTYLASSSPTSGGDSKTRGTLRSRLLGTIAMPPRPKPLVARFRWVATNRSDSRQSNRTVCRGQTPGKRGSAAAIRIVSATRRRRWQSFR